MNAPVLSDDFATVCGLKRERIAVDLYARILQCAHCQVFGVYGDWGGGKTSFLHHVRALLEAEKTPDGKVQEPSAVLWFEAWRCTADQKPVVALLHEVRRALAWNEGLAAKAKTAGKKIAGHAANLVLTALTGQIGMKPGDFTAPYSDPLPSDIIREQLEHAVSVLLDARGCARLVIFIDDLDRCQPEAALLLLEAIKIYLHLKQCVFVIGLNAREVQRAVDKVHPGTGPGDHAPHRAAEYLEKICTYPLRLPYLEASVQAEAVEKWLPPFFTAEAAANVAKLVRDYEFLPPNPRKMKSWTNTLLRFAGRNWSALATVGSDDALMAKKAAAWGEFKGIAGYAALVACLYAFHPDLHRRLQRNPDFCNDLLKWCRQPGQPDESPDALAKNHPLRAALDILEPTHTALAKSYSTAQVDSARRAVDPSLPNIFYAQRLVVGLEPTPDDLKPWLLL